MKLNLSHKIALVALLTAQNFLAIAETTTTTNPPAATSNKFVPPDYSGLPKYIANLNIFDPNRRPDVISTPRPPRPIVLYTNPPPPRVPDSFSLVGIIGYGQGSQSGIYAFFDGSGQQYHKTAKLNASIASFRVADIAADSVTLASGTNKLILAIGEQLQQDSSGHWNFAPGATPRYDTTGGYSRNNSRNSNYNGYNTGGGNNRRGGGGNYNGGGGYNTGGGGYNTGVGGGYNTGGGNNFRGRNNLQPDQTAPDNTQTIDATMPNIILLNPGDVAPADNSDQQN